MKNYHDRFFQTLVREFEGARRLFQFLRTHPIRRALMWQFCRRCRTQKVLAEQAASEWFHLYALPQIGNDSRNQRINGV